MNREGAGDCCDMRGMLGFLILFLLSKKPMHGQELAGEIANRKGEKKPSPGTIYPALKSLREAGKGGMGEYVVDVQFRDLKRQMFFIKEKLYDAHLKRQEYRKQRLRKGMFIVSLVGYTSSGKTTLFNLLTKEDKETSASLFTTLSTTTRSLSTSHSSKASEKSKDILLVDTVGFISRLPHYMIEAFKSTLEESLEADLILFLIDSSEELEDIGTKYSSSWDVLKDLEVDKSKLYILLTKADTANYQKLNEIIDYMEPSIDKLAISSKTGYGINKLKNIIISKKADKEKTENNDG